MSVTSLCWTHGQISPHSFIPCSERIHVAVTEMAALFPKVWKHVWMCFAMYFCIKLPPFTQICLVFSRNFYLKQHILMFLCRSRAQRLWEDLCACWPPVRTGFRASAGRRCLRRAARDRTCSWSPSRSSNVLMTLPRQRSSLSPSPQRRIPTNSTYRAAKPSASQSCSYIYIFNDFVGFCICGIGMRCFFLFMDKYWLFKANCGQNLSI